MIAALLLLGGSTLTTSCTDYQEEIDALEYRIKVLEELVKTANSQLETLSAVVKAMEDGDYITDVKETEDGYIVKFHKAGLIEIKNGKDGLNGEDAKMPDISVRQDPTDGQWYWTIDGDYLRDPQTGQKIRVNGKDGTDGADAVSPQVRINPETGLWEISTDGGNSWTSTGTKATGEDGTDGNQFIMNVTYSEDSSGAYMVITTKAGQTLRIPILKNQ